MTRNCGSNAVLGWMALGDVCRCRKALQPEHKSHGHEAQIHAACGKDRCVLGAVLEVDAEIVVGEEGQEIIGEGSDLRFGFGYLDTAVILTEIVIRFAGDIVAGFGAGADLELAEDSFENQRCCEAEDVDPAAGFGLVAEMCLVHSM